MISANELRSFSKEDLDTELYKAQENLQKLIQQKHSKKVTPFAIKNARKDVTRIKFIQHENKVKEYVQIYKNKKKMPKELRPKLNRAKRLALTNKQKNLKSRKQRILQKKYPKQVFSFTE